MAKSRLHQWMMIDKLHSGRLGFGEKELTGHEAENDARSGLVFITARGFRW